MRTTASRFFGGREHGEPVRLGHGLFSEPDDDIVRQFAVSAFIVPHEPTMHTERPEADDAHGFFQRPVVVGQSLEPSPLAKMVPPYTDQIDIAVDVSHRVQYTAS